LFAFDGEVAVGWCQLTPRDALPWLDHTWRLKRVDVVPVSSLSCFYVRKGYRKRGVASALIAAALNAAKRVNAPALEACPLDADLTPSASGTGYASTFARRIQDGGSPPAASPDYAPRPQGNVGMHPDHPGSKRRRPNKLAGELRKELVTASRDGKVARACPQ
jgi:GNAT superfamily N-acetyltransferase